MGNQTIIYIVTLYISVIDALTEITVGDPGKHIYVETQGGAIRNFRPADFRRGLKARLAPGERVDCYLEIFKVLGYIICGPERYTNVQKIGGVSRRVISVNMKKYGLWKLLSQTAEP